MATDDTEAPDFYFSGFHTDTPAQWADLAVLLRSVAWQLAQIGIMVEDNLLVVGQELPELGSDAEVDLTAAMLSIQSAARGLLGLLETGPRVVS
jgi:hypothetical protein